MIHECFTAFFPIAVDHAAVIIPFVNDICRDGREIIVATIAVYLALRLDRYTGAIGLGLWLLTRAPGIRISGSRAWPWIQGARGIRAIIGFFGSHTFSMLTMTRHWPRSRRRISCMLLRSVGIALSLPCSLFG
jgi:hypothetical protein